MSKSKPYIPIEFPPKDLILEPFIKKIGQANRGVALFDGILRALPNPDILLAPLITNEAVLSSRIEGNQPSFYLSEYFEKNRDEYYDRLLMITKDGNWSGWIDFFLTAVIQQAKINIDKAQKLLNLYSEMKDRFIQATKSQYAIPALDAFFKQPVIDTKSFLELIKAPRKSGIEVLNKLVYSNLIILRTPSKGNNPAVYEFAKILDIINA